MAKLPSENISALGYYLKEVLYENWKNDRHAIETEMQKNLDAFNAAITGDFWKSGETEDWRSDTFVEITKTKVIGAYSMIIDTMLQGGQYPFDLKPSPWDDVVFEDLPPEQKRKSQDDIDDMKRTIEQQLLDCHADRQLMKNVMAAAIYGETYGKYYIHEVERSGFKSINVAQGENLNINTPEFFRWEPHKQLIDSPAVTYVSNWSIFRDLEDEDLQESAGISQRELWSPYNLRQKMGRPNSYWIDNAIKRAIANADTQTHVTGPTNISSDTTNLPPGLRNIKYRQKTIEVLEFWVRVPREIAESFEKDLAKEKDTTQEESLSPSTYDALDYDPDGDEIEIMAIMADDEVVRYSRNYPKSRPFYRVLWEINLDETSGTGVPKNLRAVQKVINGAVRAFEDNKKLSANIIAVTKRQFVPDWDGTFKPGQEIEISDECDDARKAIAQLVIQDVGDTLLTLIGLFERYADEISQLPKILQGSVHTKDKPDTLGEMNMLQANAGKYLGSVIKNFDEGLIEPVITDFYRYNMLDPNIQKGKGNYIATALGFTSFQNQTIRLQKLMQGLGLVIQDPELRQLTKLKDILEEIWKALDVDISQVLKTPEELQAEAQQQAQMQAQIEAKTRQLINEEAMRFEAGKQADHRREMELLMAKTKSEIDKIEEKFENDLILKKVESAKKQKEAPKGGSA